VYAVLSGTGKRTEGRISIQIQDEVQSSVIGETLGSAETLEEEP
jgi:hypothetical protein